MERRRREEERRRREEEERRRREEEERRRREEEERRRREEEEEERRREEERRLREEEEERRAREEEERVRMEEEKKAKEAERKRKRSRKDRRRMEALEVEELRRLNKMSSQEEEHEPLFFQDQERSVTSPESVASSVISPPHDPEIASVLSHFDVIVEKLEEMTSANRESGSSWPISGAEPTTCSNHSPNLGETDDPSALKNTSQTADDDNDMEDESSAPHAVMADLNLTERRLSSFKELQLHFAELEMTSSAATTTPPHQCSPLPLRRESNVTTTAASVASASLPPSDAALLLKTSNVRMLVEQMQQRDSRSSSLEASDPPPVVPPPPVRAQSPTITKKIMELRGSFEDSEHVLSRHLARRRALKRARKESSSMDQDRGGASPDPTSCPSPIDDGGQGGQGQTFRVSPLPLLSSSKQDDTPFQPPTLPPPPPPCENHVTSSPDSSHVTPSESHVTETRGHEQQWRLMKSASEATTGGVASLDHDVGSYQNKQNHVGESGEYFIEAPVREVCIDELLKKRQKAAMEDESSGRTKKRGEGGEEGGGREELQEPEEGVDSPPPVLDGGRDAQAGRQTDVFGDDLMMDVRELTAEPYKVLTYMCILHIHCTYMYMYIHTYIHCVEYCVQGIIFTYSVLLSCTCCHT